MTVWSRNREKAVKAPAAFQSKNASLKGGVIIPVIFSLKKLAFGVGCGCLFGKMERAMDYEQEQAEAMRALTPYLKRIFQIFPNAVSTYNSEYAPHLLAEHTDGAAAYNIWCHIHSQFQKEFLDEPGFELIELLGSLYVWNVRDEIVFRYKKVDSNGRHRNHDSCQQRDFDRQYELPGIPNAAQRLVLGYHPDPALSSVERVIVRSPVLDWSCQIIEEEDEVSWVDITPARLPFSHQKRRRASDE